MRRWHRWQAHFPLTPAAKVLKEQIEELQRADDHAVGAERTLLQNHNQWCEENDVHDEDDWRRPALHRSSGGQHAYPSFSNLFNTCYINAPLQCLLHCPAVRAKLLSEPLNDVQEDLVLQDEEGHEIRVLLDLLG